MKAAPSKILDDIYANGKQPFDFESQLNTEKESATGSEGELAEKMLLHKDTGRQIAEALGVPELDIELDRAVWQVEKALREKQELKEEEKSLKEANAKPKEK